MTDLLIKTVKQFNIPRQEAAVEALEAFRRNYEGPTAETKSNVEATRAALRALLPLDWTSPFCPRVGQPCGAQTARQ